MTNETLLSLSIAGTQHRTPNIVVVGAGIIGASISYALLRRGARVTVVDREGPASFTTAASFAWIENQSSFRNGEGMSDELAHHYFLLHRMGMLAWRQLSAEIGNRLGVSWHGAIQMGSKGSPDAKLLHDDLSRRQRWGSPSFAVGPEQIRALVPGIDLEDGIQAFVSMDEGHVDPIQASVALMDEVRALGAEVLYGREVTGIEAVGDHVKAVLTPEGPIACDHVIFATGVSSPEMVRDLGINVPLEPSQGVLVHLAPIKTLLKPVLITPDLHIQQRFDGRVVMAKHYSGTPVSDPGGLDPDVLLVRAKELLPEIAGGAVERVTVGERVVPVDGLPIVGHSIIVKGVHSLTTNAGITLGPVLGELMATEILTGSAVEALEPFRSTRFDTA